MLEVERSYQISEEKCKGFINKFNECRSGHRTKCDIQKGNVEACVYAVIKDTFLKWKANMN
jgi:hypothetical protein